MKKLLTILFFLITATAIAGNNYHVGSGGSDAANGLTIATRWATTAKASSFVFANGDSLLFRAGEIFYGTLKILSNGVQISKYGAGANPVISGFTTLTGWVNVGTNLYECTPGVTLKNNVNILTINNVPQAVGRTPNSTYYVYQSATNTTLTSSTLTGAFANMVGAEIVMKKNSFTGEKAKITSQSGTTVSYIRTLPIDNDVLVAVPGTAGYGFFLQRYEGSLDIQGEWFYNTTTKKMRIFSTVNPSTLTIKASYVDTLIFLGNHTNISVSNLAIEGGGCYGVESYYGQNVTIKNCTFNNNTKAVYAWNTNNTVVDNNTINNSFSNAILVMNKQTKQVTITNNYVTNTGMLIGMGLYWSDNNLKGIVGGTNEVTAGNFVNIIGNRVINTGYTGFQYRGSNVRVVRNIVDTFCSTLDDGGAIYTFTNNASLNNINYVNRVVDSNFMSNAIGSPGGSNGIVDVVGYYLDDQAANVSGKHNTIWNIPGMGMQMNTGHHNIFTGNTIYNCNYFLALNKRHAAETYNNVITKNVMYQKVSTQGVVFHTNNNLQLPTVKTITQSIQQVAFIDSNWITNTRAAGFHYYYFANGTTPTFPPDFNYAAWGSTYGHDLVSTLPPVAVTNSNTTLYTNPSDTVKNIAFSGLRKTDPKGNNYDNNVILQRWSSLILIDNGTAATANVSPSASAGENVSITFPSSDTTLYGGGNDSDGTISSYSWAVISGPSGSSFGTPNAATTTFNNLSTGVYEVELTVTDNNGAVGKDTVQVTVKAAAPVPSDTIILMGWEIGP